MNLQAFEEGQIERILPIEKVTLESVYLQEGHTRDFINPPLSQSPDCQWLSGEEREIPH